MKCSNNECNASLEPEWKFCPECGSKILNRNPGLPSIDLLNTLPDSDRRKVSEAATETAALLQSALEELGVDTHVLEVKIGASVSSYTVLLSEPSLAEEISSLTDKLAEQMTMESVRVVPHPDPDCCCIEIPNTEKCPVCFREIIESKAFRDPRCTLPLALGTNLEGKTIVQDLTKMPHLLIAGSDETEINMCINSMLSGLLMKYSSDNVQFILVGSKANTFNPYSNLPHLLVDVTAEPSKAQLGLKWAIDEMERRFKYFNKIGVRDISSFKQRTTEINEDTPEVLPYIVIIISELADLMEEAKAETEANISRLAAKCRGAGIHLIIASQQPEEKVITGIIQANVPARIAFSVAKKKESHAILCKPGAEALLGEGDMLMYSPLSDDLIRIQGAFISDGEIERITAAMKNQKNLVELKTDEDSMDTNELDDWTEEGVGQALEHIRNAKKDSISTSSLQRQLKVSYPQAARILDVLEERGIIAPPEEGMEDREILIDLITL